MFRQNKILSFPLTNYTLVKKQFLSASTRLITTTTTKPITITTITTITTPKATTTRLITTKPITTPKATKTPSPCMTNLTVISSHRNLFPLKCQKNGNLSRYFSSTTRIDETTYHRLADQTLIDIQDSVDTLEDIIEDLDVSLSQGVLSLKLGKHGTWVINKQSPNLQIWWSSPLSGPKRYEYSLEEQQWINTRDKSPLLKQLQHEMEKISGTVLEMDTKL